MELYSFDTTMNHLRIALTDTDIIEAIETKEINKAGQLSLTIPAKELYTKGIFETDIVMIKVSKGKYHAYKITSRTISDDKVVYTGIEYAYYLMAVDGVVHDKRPSDLDLRTVIGYILEGTGFEVGYIDSSLPKYTGRFYWQSRIDCLSQLSEATGVEFEFYFSISNNKITKRVVDLYKKQGTDTHRIFNYGMNLLEVVAETDSTELYTKAYGRGKGIEYENGADGTLEDSSYGRRITFSDVVWQKSKGDPVDKPKGQDYVTDGLNNWRLDNGNEPSQILTFDNIDDPAELLKTTYEWILENNHPKTQFKATIGNIGDLALGDRVVIKREDLGISYITRVYKVQKNLLNENLTQIELGDQVTSNLTDSIKAIQTTVNNLNSNQSKIEQQISFIDGNGAKVTYGPVEPSTKSVGDLWYKPTDIVDGIQQYDLLMWDGDNWVTVLGSETFEELNNAIDSMQDEVDEAKNKAQQAVDKAGEIEKNFNTEIGSVKIDISNVNNSAQNALQQAQSAINKADFNNSEITKIQKQQSADSQRLTTIESNYNGLQTTVVNLQNDTNSRFNQFSDLINANVSKIESNKQQIANVQQSFDRFQVDIKNGDVDNLFVDSEFYDLDAIKSNWYRSNLKVLDNEDYAGSRILYWNGTGAGWGYLQFQSVQIPFTLSDKVTVGFDYRYQSADQFLASFYFMNEDSSQILKKHEIWFKGTEEEANQWLRFSMTAPIPDDTHHIDFKIFANGSKILNFSRPRIYAGSIDWGYNLNSAYSQAQIKVQADRIEETVQNQDSLNKRVQTAEGTIDSIENMTGSNTLINTVNGMKQEVTDAKGNASQALQTAQGVQTSVYNTGNIWMTPDFQTTPLSKYTNTSDTDGNVRIVTNGVPNSATEAVKYNQPYKKRNNSNKSIRFEGRTDGNRDCFQKEEYNIQVAGGDRFDISFDFYKTPEGSAGVGFKLIAEDGSISWIALYAKQESLGSWWHIDGQIEVPSDKQYIKAQAFISYGKVSSSSGQYCYMDNISIKKVTGSNYAQYSTITQTIEGIQTQVQDNEGNISKVTQTAQGIVSSVNNIQSVLGPTYPNGSFIDKDFNKYYTAQNSVSGATATIPSTSDYLQLKTGVNAKASAMLTDYIEFDMNKPIEFRFKAYFNNTTYDKPRMYVHEYDKDYKEVRNGNDSIFKGTDKAGTWYEVKKSWIVDKTNKPKYFRVEWVCWDNGSGNNELRIANASLSNGQANIGTNITQLQDDINLRVKKGDVITQINLDSSGVLIDGAKNHITGQTTIDNAVIKSSMIDTITANKITTGTLNAANVKIINLDVNSLTGNLTQFVQTQWNSVNSGVSIDGNGLKIKASNGENIILNNGTFQFRDNNNKEIIGISRFSDGAVNLAVRKGERFSISYDGTDSTDNAFAEALAFHGTTGSITFSSQKIWFQDRELRFTTMDWGNGRIPSIRNTDNVAGIGLGSKALYFGDSVGILTLDNIRNGKLNKITFPDGRALTLKSGTISGTSVGYLVGTNDVGIAWSGGDMYFHNNYTSGWIKFNDILKKLGFV